MPVTECAEAPNSRSRISLAALTIASPKFLNSFIRMSPNDFQMMNRTISDSLPFHRKLLQLLIPSDFKNKHLVLNVDNFHRGAQKVHNKTIVSISRVYLMASRSSGDSPLTSCSALNRAALRSTACVPTGLRLSLITSSNLHRAYAKKFASLRAASLRTWSHAPSPSLSSVNATRNPPPQCGNYERH